MHSSMTVDQPFKVMLSKDAFSPGMFSQMIPPTVNLHIMLASTDVVKLVQIIAVDVVLSGQLPQLLEASML